MRKDEEEQSRSGGVQRVVCEVLVQHSRPGFAEVNREGLDDTTSSGRNIDSNYLNEFLDRVRIGLLKNFRGVHFAVVHRGVEELVGAWILSSGNPFIREINSEVSDGFDCGSQVHP